jgi:hypothetical protein
MDAMPQLWFTVYNYDRALPTAHIAQHVLRLCNVLTQTFSAAFTTSGWATWVVSKYNVNMQLVVFLCELALKTSRSIERMWLHVARHGCSARALLTSSNGCSVIACRCSHSAAPTSGQFYDP